MQSDDFIIIRHRREPNPFLPMSILIIPERPWLSLFNYALYIYNANVHATFSFFFR